MTSLPVHAYTPWLRRVGAGLIDAVPVAVLFGVCLAVLLSTRTCIEFPVAGLGTGEDPFIAESCGASTVGQTAAAIFPLVTVAYLLWNHGFKQGTTGQSIGKGVLKFKVVSEETGQPI